MTFLQPIFFNSATIFFQMGGITNLIPGKKEEEVPDPNQVKIWLTLFYFSSKKFAHGSNFLALQVEVWTNFCYTLELRI